MFKWFCTLALCMYIFCTFLYITTMRSILLRYPCLFDISHFEIILSFYHISLRKSGAAYLLVPPLGLLLRRTFETWFNFLRPDISHLSSPIPSSSDLKMEKKINIKKKRKIKNSIFYKESRYFKHKIKDYKYNQLPLYVLGSIMLNQYIESIYCMLHHTSLS